MEGISQREVQCVEKQHEDEEAEEDAGSVPKV